MKSKFYLAILLVAVILVSVQCKKKAGVKTEPVYGSLAVDLKPFYPADTLMKMNTKLYNAATKCEILGYASDSLSSKISKEDILKKGGTEELIQMGDPKDPKGKRFIDTVIRTYLNPKDISSNTVSYILKYDEKKGEYQVVFTGFAPSYSLTINGIFLGTQDLFYVSKEDLVKLFGQKETSALYANCYKAILKTLNYNKTIVPDKITSFYTKINEYVGEYILDDVNIKMYNAVTKGLGGAPLNAYQSDDLSKTYSAEEVLKRGASEEALEMGNPNDPNGLPIDTIVLNEFRPQGNKLYALSFEWKYDADKMVAYPKLNAFGIALSYEKDKKTAYNTLFWFDWKNANKIYNTSEVSLLEYSFFKVLGNYRNLHLQNQ